jgi:myosin heavy subunit
MENYQDTISTLQKATEQATTVLSRASGAEVALQQRVRALEDELRKAKEQQSKAAKEVNALKDDNAELKDDIREAHTEIKLLSQDQELLQKELDLERSSNKRLQNELREFENNRPEDFLHLDEILGTLDERRKQCKQLEKQLQVTKLTEQQLEHSKATIEKLTGRIWGLKDERDLKEPLVQTAVATRCRFMLQAREKLSRDLGEDLDTEYVKLGDSAAHRGDGLADEALLLAGFLDSERWASIFEELYGTKLGEFADVPRGLRRAKDCEVTIRVVQSVRGARPSFQARSEAEGTILAITKEYEKDGDGAESSSIVQNSIQRVEQLTEEIVESARGRLADRIFSEPIEKS